MSGREYREVTVSSKVCLICGALVADRERHDVWHVDRQPALGPDPWEEAIEDTGIAADRRGWEKHLARALRGVATAIEGAEDVEYYRNCLAVAAANIRAMAPEGTQWEEPWKVQQGTERNTLRSVIRALVHADTKRGPSSADTAEGLVTADTYLHGLWLAAEEKP